MPCATPPPFWRRPTAQTWPREKSRGFSYAVVPAASIRPSAARRPISNNAGAKIKPVQSILTFQASSHPERVRPYQAVKIAAAPVILGRSPGWRIRDPGKTSRPGSACHVRAGPTRCARCRRRRARPRCRSAPQPDQAAVPVPAAGQQPPGAGRFAAAACRLSTTQARAR